MCRLPLRHCPFSRVTNRRINGKTTSGDRQKALSGWNRPKRQEPQVGQRLANRLTFPGDRRHLHFFTGINRMTKLLRGRKRITSSQ